MRWAAATLTIASAVAVAVAAFLPGADPDTRDGARFPGSILDLTPGYGTLLIVAGVLITGLAVVATVRRSTPVAFVAMAAGALVVVSVGINNLGTGGSASVKTYSYFDLWGTGAKVALAGGLGSAVFALCLAALVRDEDSVPVKHRKETGKPLL